MHSLDASLALLKLVAVTRLHQKREYEHPPVLEILLKKNETIIFEITTTGGGGECCNVYVIL